MKHSILIFSAVLLMMSCSKNEYKVNCTFNHFDIQTKRTYTCNPVDLHVLANNSNELKEAVKETLSKEYLLFTVDSININNFEITQNNSDKIINMETINFNITDINETYNYLNLFKKTFVLKCNLTKIFTKYSPEQYNNQAIGNVYLSVKNRQVKLIDSWNNLLLAFEIFTPKEFEKWKNRIAEPNVEKLNVEMILLPPSKYYNSYLKNNSQSIKEGYSISFLGKNQYFKNIVVSFYFEDYGNDGININQIYISYSKNGIKYYWNCLPN